MSAKELWEFGGLLTTEDNGIIWQAKRPAKPSEKPVGGKASTGKHACLFDLLKDHENKVISSSKAEFKGSSASGANPRVEKVRKLAEVILKVKKRASKDPHLQVVLL